jgi:dephospho-CoA kinase
MKLRSGPQAPVIVVMGPSGAGKTLVCRWLDERGAFVLDADRIGHEMLELPAVRAALVARFGPEIAPAGPIDRRRLGPIVFADPQALTALNSIVHPPLVQEIDRRIADLRQSRAVELMVVDAALHFRFVPPLRCDLVVGILADASLRKMRIMQRDGLSPEQAEARLLRQAQVVADVARADVVLRNDGEPMALRQALLQALDERLGTSLRASDAGPWEDRTWTP